MIDLSYIKIISDKKVPERKTQPKSFYRDLVGQMKTGDWCIVKDKDKGRFVTGVTTYARGRYAFFKHPEKKGQYVFSITK
jgi:hypothetical protein